MNLYIEFNLYIKANRDPDQLPIVPAGNIHTRNCLPFFCTSLQYFFVQNSKRFEG